jgi:hypothetical protein
MVRTFRTDGKFPAYRNILILLTQNKERRRTCEHNAEPWFYTFTLIFYNHYFFILIL